MEISKCSNLNALSAWRIICQQKQQTSCSWFAASVKTTWSILQVVLPNVKPPSCHLLFSLSFTTVYSGGRCCLPLACLLNVNFRQFNLLVFFLRLLLLLLCLWWCPQLAAPIYSLWKPPLRDGTEMGTNCFWTASVFGWPGAEICHRPDYARGLKGVGLSNWSGSCVKIIAGPNKKRNAPVRWVEGTGVLVIRKTLTSRECW